ncbi:MAG: MFS transporter [Traorella sp.]
MKKLWNRDFILMLQGNLVSALGDVLYSVAIGYWVYEKTGSSALMGLMSSISMFVVMFVTPFSGTIVDKLNRKKVIVGMDVARGAIMLIVGILAYMEQLSVTIVLVAAFFAALCSVFFGPAVSTLFIDIIPHDDMVRGQSVQSGVTSFINLVGKAVSGALVAFLGVPFIIILNGISYIISALTETFIRVPKTSQQGNKVTIRSVLTDFKIAIKDIISNPFLQLFIPFAILLNFLGAGPSTLMLPFVLEKGMNVEMYGYLMSIETCASLVCVTLLGIIKLKPQMRFMGLAFGFISSCFFYILTYLSKDFTMMACFIFLGCFSNTLGNAIFNASFVLALPEQNRGAILGFLSAASTGGSALSAVLYGILCDIFPCAYVFIAGSAISILPMIYLCIHPTTKEFILNH